MQLIRVVFPDPLGPIKPTNSPAVKEIDTRERAWSPPKFLLTFSICNIIAALCSAIDSGAHRHTGTRWAGFLGART
jgi:hypothetical protein